VLASPIRSPYTFPVLRSHLNVHCHRREAVSTCITGAERRSQHASPAPRGDPNAEVTRSGLHFSAPASAIQSDYIAQAPPPRCDLNVSLAPRDDLSVIVTRSERHSWAPATSLRSERHFATWRWMGSPMPPSSFPLDDHSQQGHRDEPKRQSPGSMGSPIPTTTSPFNYYWHQWHQFHSCYLTSRVNHSMTI
jgi:hypothetical protein